MTDAFLAYARKDLKSATEIKDFLEQEGLSVWQDIQIAPGELWRDVILQHLERAKTVIVLWSSSSVNSEWVRAEAQIAADRNKLIPVLIEQVDLPLGFSHYQYLDFTDKKNISASLERLLRAIAQISKFDRRSIEPRPDTPGARVVVPAGRPYKKLPAASSTKVFLAHASADKPRLKPIIIALIEQGFKLWIDKPQAIGLLPRYEEKIALDRIHFGNDWKEDIRKAIKKAHVVLACWSQDAVKG